MNIWKHGGPGLVDAKIGEGDSRFRIGFAGNMLDFFFVNKHEKTMQIAARALTEWLSVEKPQEDTTTSSHKEHESDAQTIADTSSCDHTREQVKNPEAAEPVFVSECALM